MARPKKHAAEKRDQRFNLRFTVAEIEELRAQAVTVGLDPHEYSRRRVLGHVVSAPASRSESALISELTRIGTRIAKAGNNLNQIARVANSGAVPLAVSVDPAVAENAAVLAELRVVLAQVAADYGS